MEGEVSTMNAKWMRIMMGWAVALAVSVGFTACNTIEGAGEGLSEDAEQTEQAIDEMDE